MADDDDEFAGDAEIKALQNEVAIRDRALAEAVLRADEQAAEIALLRLALAERHRALGRVEAAAQECAAALTGAYEEARLMREEVAFLRRAADEHAGLAAAVKKADALSAQLKITLKQRAETDAALSRAQQTGELRGAALEAAQTELAALRQELAVRDAEPPRGADRPEMAIEGLPAQAERETAIGHRVTLVASYRGYNLVELDETVIALRQDLGPVDLRSEKLGDRDLPPFVLRCEIVDQQAEDLLGVLQKRIDALLGS